MFTSNFKEIKKFVLSAAAYFLTLALLFGLLDGVCLFRQGQKYGTMDSCRNDNAYIQDVPDGIQICNFGSSHGYYGFNYEDISDQICFNFALPSQSLSYDYRILQNYLANIENDAVAVIIISYMSLFGNPEEESANFLSKNNRYYLFLESSYIKRYDKTTDLYVRFFPVFTFSNPFILLKNCLGLDNEDWWTMETDERDAKTHGYARYQSHVKANIDPFGTRVVDTESVEALKEMIRYCKNNCITPVLITTPYLSEYPNAVKENDSDFFNNFYDSIYSISEETGINYYDYSMDQRFSKNYDLFFNTDHLNRKGARKFTNILMDEVISQYIK